MYEAVSNYDQPIKFIIGFAGSGKSTRLSEEACDDTLILTPTHKAKEVLERKGLQNVFTIHSVLKLVPTIDQNFNPKKHKMQRLQRIGDVDLKHIKRVFIDEYSMINVAILDMLLAILPLNCQVVVFGDSYQLPPVDGEAIEPEMYTDNIEELTIQHRAEAPEVVDSFMRFMQYIKEDNPKIDLRLHKDIKHGDVSTFNPETDRALAFTNAEVYSINQDIARSLGLPNKYSQGEALSLNGIDCTLVDDDNMDYANFIFPNCISKGKLMKGEKLDTTVRNTMRDIEKYGTDLSGYKMTNIVVDGVERSIYYDTKHYETNKKLKGDVEYYQQQVIDDNDIPDDVKIADWCRVNRGKPHVRERGQAWSAYIAHSNLVFNLQRPFATTVHKSQGSEFDTVYVAQADMKKAIRRGYYMQYARLMYVALSRAIKKVVII